MHEVVSCSNCGLKYRPMSMIISARNALLHVRYRWHCRKLPSFNNLSLNLFFTEGLKNQRAQIILQKIRGDRYINIGSGKLTYQLER
jgi:hypothetical protein